MSYAIFPVNSFNKFEIIYEDNSRDGNVFLEVGFDLAANSLVTLDV